MAGEKSTLDKLAVYFDFSSPGLHIVEMERVPPFLPREGNCFNPETVSIGPYFRHISFVIDNKVKLAMAADLIEASDNSFNTFKSNLEEVTEKGMKYYPGETLNNCFKDLKMEFDRQEQIKFCRLMLFLDCCFIVRLIELVVGGEEDKLPFGSMITRRCCRDLILLDNQIPWIVLANIFFARYGSKEETIINTQIKICEQLPSFANLVISGSTRRSPSADYINVFQQKPVHLLDIVRLHILRFVLPNRNPTRRLRVVSETLVSVRQMRERWGISCEVGQRFRDLEVRRIKFDKGCLHLPKVFICDYSEMLFMNLMALDNSLRVKGKGEISTFMWLMGVLMSDERSVSMLRSNKVVISNYKDEKIVDILKRVTYGLVPNMELLEEIVEGIEIYRESRLLRLKTLVSETKDACFSTQWRTIASITTLVVLIATTYPSLKMIAGDIMGVPAGYAKSITSFLRRDN